MISIRIEGENDTKTCHVYEDGMGTTKKGCFRRVSISYQRSKPESTYQVSIEKEYADGVSQVKRLFSKRSSK